MTASNGVYTADRGGFDWSDSVIALRPDGSTDGGVPLDSYTPIGHEAMDSQDLDLGSTTIAILPLPEASGLRLGVQSGKDSIARLLNLRDLSGSGAPRHIGGEIQAVAVPQGGEVQTRPATWTAPDGTIWVFIATDSGTTGFTLDLTGPSPSLAARWTIGGRATSPVIANAVLYLVNDHAVAAIDPPSGQLLWQDNEIGTIHWQSPIVIDNALYVEDNDGYLQAYVPK